MPVADEQTKETEKPMKKKHSSQNNFPEETPHMIPDIEIIDLEADTDPNFTALSSSALSPSQDYGSESPPDTSENDSGRPSPSGSFNSRILHLVLLAVAVIFVLGIAYKVLNWGVRVNPEDIPPGEYDNSMDHILPLVDAQGNTLRRDYSGNINILAFGNAPFADDRDSQDSLANMIQEKTNATVYNCSISGSYMAAELPSLNSWEYPLDAFSFYWMCFLAIGNEDIANKYKHAVEELGDEAPPEAMDVYNTLTGLDLNTIDVVVIMYDGSDYLAGNQMYSDENRTDIVQFTGSMEAGIELLQANYPNIRIIVMSPPYAFGIDEEGNYISSDIQRYGWSVLSTYVIKQAESAYYRLVTFVDNLYGTINEDNAPDYLIDNLHLNVEGRQKVADRFVEALYFYND